MPGTRSAGRHGGVAVHNPTFWTSRTSRWPSRTPGLDVQNLTFWTSRTSHSGRPEPLIGRPEPPLGRPEPPIGRPEPHSGRPRTPHSGHPASQGAGRPEPEVLVRSQTFAKDVLGKMPALLQVGEIGGETRRSKLTRLQIISCYRPRRRFLNVLAWRSTLYDDWHPCVLTDDAVQAVDWLLSQSSAGGGPATTSVRAILPRGCRDSRRCCTTCSATVTLENRNLL